MEQLSLKNPNDIPEDNESETDPVETKVIPYDENTPYTPHTPLENPPPIKFDSIDSEKPIESSPEHNLYGKKSPQPENNLYGNDSPNLYGNKSPQSGHNLYGNESPPFAQTSPAYEENSPEFAPHSPAYQSPKIPSGPRTPEGLPPERPIIIEKKKQSKKIVDIYSRTLVSKKVSIEMKYIGVNIKENLEKKLKDLHEGKCIAEGYVKKNTIKIVTYSSGKVCASGVLYEVAFECYVCFPVEGQLLNCIATNITKAGIKATSLETPSPFVVFISRDHQLNNKKFSSINEKDHFVARIIGQRFELNDPYISIIAEIDEKKRFIKRI